MGFEVTGAGLGGGLPGAFGINITVNDDGSVTAVGTTGIVVVAGVGVKLPGTLRHAAAPLSVHYR